MADQNELRRRTLQAVRQLMECRTSWPEQDSLRVSRSKTMVQQGQAFLSRLGRRPLDQSEALQLFAFLAQARDFVQDHSAKRSASHLTWASSWPQRSNWAGYES
jgi:hypothetical protein